MLSAYVGIEEVGGGGGGLEGLVYYIFEIC